MFIVKVVSSAELAGCFVDPGLFCKLALPHLKSAAGSSATGCSSCLMIVAALLRGCNPQLLKPHLKVQVCLIVARMRTTCPIQGADTLQTYDKKCVISRADVASYYHMLLCCLETLQIVTFM